MQGLRKVAVVGSGQVASKEAYRESFVAELVRNAVHAALDDTGLTIDDIDTLVGCGCDMMDGRSISSVFTLEACGGFMKEETKVEGDGTQAVYYAAMRIMSGAFDTALVTSYSKTSESDPHYYTGLMSEPFCMTPMGLDYVSVSALQADSYASKYGITPEQAALVSVKNMGNAGNNPYAQRKMDLSVQDVLGSKMLATPLRELDLCPSSDGAAAVILAAEGRAEMITDSPAWITGLGCCGDIYYPGQRDLTELASARKAAEQAYKAAGVKKPLKDIDVAEITEVCSYHELMLYEALGFCGDGGGGKLIESGKTEMDGELPVNPSGGCLASNPWMVTGINRVAEASLQVSGRAGERQVKGAGTALAHGADGMALQTNTVIILASSV
ncbi:MAG: thiolase family protein [Actinobacteria bacterium]|nr:thiolase family protein [Actinomycetota bacterium]MCG2818118.1 thiolase family protein [Actinomycetes bacterium]MBU4359676.1 thiolase family protein [Actinomycetota bacterium]MBU4393240.1 thiolase family protein [Actinomycetota bacterium]MBU4401147.1 thiolase family protein [Actinomycetota bacterium]